MITDGGFPKPDVIDKNGPGWKAETLRAFAANEINLPTGTFITRNAKTMSTDYENAAKIADDATQMFSKSHADLLKSITTLKDTTKKVSSEVRQSADSLAQGLLKVQKQADFNSLERYVNLLERAATAMTTLAELEKTGKLEKIAGALK